MSTYSFQQVVASIVGPGGNINVGAGAGISADGITIETVGQKNNMITGADNSGTHSLISVDASTTTIRILKTSPTNAQLMNMYQLQKLSSATWGANLITLRDSARGDLAILAKAAFQNPPNLTYATEAGFNEWIFDVLDTTIILGTGTPEAT